MNAEFFIENRKKIAEKLTDKSILILFSGTLKQKTADGVYPFTPNRNFYYLTGIDQENSILVMRKDKDEIQTTVFIKSGDPKKEKWLGHFLTKDEAKTQSGIDSIGENNDFQPWVSMWMFKHVYSEIFLDLERRSWDEDWNPAIKYSEEFRRRYPDIKINNLFSEISGCRAIKSDLEISKLKEAIRLTDDGLKCVLENARPGMMEYQLDAHFQFSLRYNGVKDLAFPTICASGGNATVLHYETNQCEIGENDLVLIDCGAQFEYYNADISRTIPASGKFSERQKVLYNLVLEVEKTVINAVKPGLTLKYLNDLCREELSRRCIDIGLIKSINELAEYFYHTVSHFLGLDGHDPLDTTTEFKPGMVITVEPGLYIEKEKIGIRIEDDILVTENGFENLSKSIPKEISDIEKLMEK